MNLGPGGAWDNATVGEPSVINDGDIYKMWYTGNNHLIGYATAPIPEPITLLLVGTGLAGLLGYGRRKFKK